MNKITLEELAEEYKKSYEELEKKLNKFKEQLNNYYDNGIFLNNEILSLRRKIVIYEDMVLNVKAVYRHLIHYNKGD